MRRRCHGRVVQWVARLRWIAAPGGTTGVIFSNPCRNRAGSFVFDVERRHPAVSSNESNPMTSQPTILVLQASPRSDGSHSRALTEPVVKRLTGLLPKASVVVRDLAATPPPHVTDEFIGAMFTPPDAQSASQKEVLALSNALVEELAAARFVVIGTPMYNNTVPSALKAWIDHIVRPGLTFSFRPDSFEGLLTGKRAFVVTASGAVYTTGPRVSEDFLTPYLKHILGFIGITDVTFVHGEGLAYDVPGGLAAAEAQIAAISV
jgi:FMN-dependent NADH-azoreductase